MPKKEKEEKKESMKEVINWLMDERGFTKDTVCSTIENAVLLAYKGTYGKTANNVTVELKDDLSGVEIYARKKIVDGVVNPLEEIDIEEAKKQNSDAEIGDEVDVEMDPETFSRSGIINGKQVAKQSFNETSKKVLYNEYKDKIGELINGYCQRVDGKGNVYVDLGNSGRIEGYLKVSLQSPREMYTMGDKIKAIIVGLEDRRREGLQLVLSRTDVRLVEILMAQEIPEIAEGVIDIVRCVREAGNRTKVAVVANEEGIDPVGSCVGPKGERIQNVIKELLGERIDVVEYDEDILTFIRNSLSPAKVNKVVITDSDKREALAIVNDDQLSLAIGKMGQNVRLANRMCDWNIDVKVEADCEGMTFEEVSPTESISETTYEEDQVEEEPEEENESEEEEAILEIKDLPNVNYDIANVLKEMGVVNVLDFIEAYDNGKLENVEGVEEDEIEDVYDLIKQNVEIKEEIEEIADTDEGSVEGNEDDDSKDVYVCPNCGTEIVYGTPKCPKCGTEFNFDENSEEEKE